MKRFNFILITLALAVVFLVAEIVIVKSAVKYEPAVTVVFAKKKIPERTVINPDMLYEKEISLSMAHVQAIKNAGELAGKKAKTDMEEGEMILISKILPADAFDEIRLKDGNNRLFTVEFRADQANGWWLREDQYVDILFVPNDNVTLKNSFQLPSEAVAQADIKTQAGGLQRLNNIRIAALIDEKGNLLKAAGNQTPPRLISFEVTNSQDEFLAYAKSNGRLEISARLQK